MHISLMLLIVLPSLVIRQHETSNYTEDEEVTVMERIMQDDVTFILIIPIVLHFTPPPLLESRQLLL